MNGVDQRGVLNDSQPFSYRATKDRKVLVCYESQLVKTLKGKQAEKLLAQLESADEPDDQLTLARVTGNFKHGNERQWRRE